MAEGIIYLNHRDKKCQHAVKRVGLLTDLLIKQRRSVLFVGEGNFTFTVAFAALRELEATPHHHAQPRSEGGSGLQAWEGIVSSRYEPVGGVSEQQYVGRERVRCKPAAILCEVQLNCIRETYRYHQYLTRHTPKDHPSLLPDHAHCLRRIGAIADLPVVPDMWEWLYGIDARHLPPDLTSGCGVVWFQGVWGEEVDEDTPSLLRYFLLNSAPQLAPGTYVCAGISKHPDYVGHYSLEDLLEGQGEGGVAPALREWYSLVGGDDLLVKRLLEFGYRHQGYYDIHHYIRDSHVTLVFQRH